MTEVEIQAINDYLVEVVKNNYKCQHCILNHDGICFFAYECVKNSFKYYLDD